MAFAFWLFLSLSFVSGKDQTRGQLLLIYLWKTSIGKHLRACICFGWNNIYVNCRPQTSEQGSNTKNKEKRQTAPRTERYLDYHLDPPAEVQHDLVMLQKSWEKMILRDQHFTALWWEQKENIAAPMAVWSLDLGGAFPHRPWRWDLLAWPRCRHWLGQGWLQEQRCEGGGF